jgi:RHS repeat-associated protein
MKHKYSLTVLSLLFLFTGNHLFSQEILPVNYVSPPSLTRNLDYQKPVSTIPGVVDVSNGISSYTIPITLPPGIQGMAPELSISYNSTGGNGILGWSWSLNGLSEIRRGNRKYIFDNVPLAVYLDAGDRLYLDGEAMSCYTGLNLQLGSTYKTQNEGFRKVEMISSGGFEVIEKNGVKRIYGDNTSSRILLKDFNSDDQIYIWPIEKIIDINSNYIQYEYDNSNNKNESRIKKIKYTGNQEKSYAPQAEIEFVYATKNDLFKGYVNGNNVEQTVLLKEMIIRYDGQLYGKYKFNYSYNNDPKTGNDFSKLVEIEYFNSLSEEVNSTLIQWNQPSQEVNVSAVIPPHETTNFRDRIVFMDINGDGIEDILELKHSQSAPISCWVGLNSTPYRNQQFEVFANIRNPATNDFTRYSVVSQFNSQYTFAGCTRKAYCEIHPGDFNGDGLMDFLFLRASGSQSGGNNYYVNIYTNDPNNPGHFNHYLTQQITDHLPYGYDPMDTDWCDPSENSPSPNQYPPRIVVSDFDGDGYTDFSYSGASETTSSSCGLYEFHWVINYMGATGIDQKKNHLFGLTGTTVDSIMLGDFTGDGKPEALVLNGMNSEILMFYYGRSLTQLRYGGFPTSHHHIVLGDFNGDGKSDVLIRNEYNDWFIHYFDGRSFVYPSVDLSSHLSIYNSNPDKPGSPYRLRVADVDKDGRDDIVFLENNNPLTAAVTDVNVYYNKVTGWTSSTISGAMTIHGRGAPFSLISFTDFTGDGSVGLYCFPFWEYVIFRPGDKSHYVHQILDGFNTLTTFDFKPMTDPSVYARVNNYSYPSPSLMAPFYLASSVEQTGKFGTKLLDQEFFYKGLRFNKKGLGLLGFEEEIQINLINNSRSRSYSHIPPVSNSFKQSLPMLPWKQEIEAQDGGGNWQLLSRSETYYDQDIFKTFNGGFNYLFLPLETKTYNYLEGTSTHSEIIYDVSGNPLEQKESVYDSDNLSGSVFFEKITTNSNFVSSGSWIPWVPEQVEVTQQRTGENPVSTIKHLEYNNGNLQKITVNPNTEAQTIKEFTYDSYGNIIQRKLTPMSMNPRISEFTMTSCNRFIENSFNPLNWMDHYEYDLLLGVKTRHFDVNGQVTDYEYDGFGRPVKTIYPDGNAEEQEIVWNIGFGPSSYLYAIHSHGTVSPSKVAFYDDAERAIQKSATNTTGVYVHVETEYNARGELVKESLPFFDGQTKVWNHFDYDFLSRVVETATPHVTIQNTYNGREIVTGNITTSETQSKEKDPLGLVISATDEGGTITYAYNSFGKPKTITGPSNMPIVSLYDDYGRQTELQDPAAGTISYEYDALGQLLRQTDQKEQMFEMEYDILGRMTKKTGAGGVYNFYFDSQMLGLLDEAHAPNGIFTTYTYDGLGRLIQKFEEINSEHFISEYTYNTNGLPHTYMFPNGFSIKYEYNAFNELTSIKRNDNNANIWTYQDENHIGQITGYKLGANDWFRTYHNTSAFPETWYNQANTFSRTYDFELTTGNLEERVNQINGAKDEFSYDNVNRLTGITSTNAFSAVNNLSMTYSSTGDIQTKTDVGAYDNESASGRTVSVSDGQSIISDFSQIIEYTDFNKISAIAEGDYDAYFIYGPDQQRRYMHVYERGSIYIERYYTGDFERDFSNGEWRNICYIPLPSGDLALFIEPDGAQGEIWFAYQDYQGNIMAIADNNGNIAEEYSYDAWGNRRDPNTLKNYYSLAGSVGVWQGFFYRGYTGHEHLECFGLINMNGRLYDPILGRMLIPDNYVQAPDYSQNFNRYSYAWNNPLKYTDPSGDFIVTATIIGAVVGAYIGASIANESYNPKKWDMSSGRTWGYMLGGALVGAASGYLGASIATSGIPMAKTAGIMSASFTNSFGTNIYTGGQTDVSVNFGIASVNLTKGKFGYLGKKGNSALENIGYGLGAIANVSDVLAGLPSDRGDVVLVTENSDAIGHSALVDDNGNTLVSVGPDQPGVYSVKELARGVGGTNTWNNYNSSKYSDVTNKIVIKNVNIKRIANYTAKLNLKEQAGTLKYNLFTSSCVTHTARALNMAGALNFGSVHPFLLNAQMAIRDYHLYLNFHYLQLKK